MTFALGLCGENEMRLDDQQIHNFRIYHLIFLPILSLTSISFLILYNNYKFVHLVFFVLEKLYYNVCIDS